MKLPSAIVSAVAVAVWLPPVLGQAVPACSADLATSEDCAAVINPNACYNEFGFRGQQTLNCVEGKNNADKARKVSRLHLPPPASCAGWL